MPKIESAHGAGGKIMQRLLEDIIIPSFGRRKSGDIGLDEMDDGDDLCLYYGFGQNNRSHVNSWLQLLDRLGSKGLGLIIDSSYSGRIINEYS